MIGRVLKMRRGTARAVGTPRPVSPMAYLPGIELFRGLPLPLLEAFARTMAVRECAAGTVFFTPEDSSETLFFLKSGTVDLYQLSPNGRRVTLGRLSTGAIFGDMGLLGQTMHGCFAEALEPSLVCVATRSEVLRFLSQHSEVALKLLEAVGRRLKELEERFARLALNSVRVRLADIILSQMDPETREVKGLTHAEIGEMIGALRQTVTETLNAMQGAGLLEVGHKRVRVINEDGLRQMLKEAG